MAHLWLVGMMGSGKSTVGKLLSDFVDLPFLDTDSEVERTSGLTIPELFARGEPVFRSVEAAVISTVADGPASVIATGGGTVLREDSVTHMNRSGRIVHLGLDVPTMEERLEEDESALRPLLSDGQSSSHLHRERAALYASVCDVTVSTIGKTPTEIAEEVAAWADM